MSKSCLVIGHEPRLRTHHFTNKSSAPSNSPLSKTNGCHATQTFLRSTPPYGQSEGRARARGAQKRRPGTVWPSSLSNPSTFGSPTSPPFLPTRVYILLPLEPLVEDPKTRNQPAEETLQFRPPCARRSRKRLSSASPAPRSTAAIGPSAWSRFATPRPGKSSAPGARASATSKSCSTTTAGERWKSSRGTKTASVGPGQRTYWSPLPRTPRREQRLRAVGESEELWA